jgi:hypothetical protein
LTKNLFLIKGKAWAKNLYVRSRLKKFRPALIFYKAQ